MAYFLAPPWYNAENFRTVGFSSTADKGVALRGCRYLWPEGLPIQVEQPDSPAGWARLVVAVVPDGEADPATAYAHVTCRDTADLSRVTPGTVTLVADDAGSPDEWERMTLVITDPDFWAEFGATWVVPGIGTYFAEDYRATVCIPAGQAPLVPPTWASITRDDAKARHPNAGI